MLKLNVSSIEHAALQCLSFLLPTAQLIPSSATNAEKQYRDETKRKECEDDELTVSGSNLRVASALSCVDVTAKLRGIFPKVSCPFLLLIADEDVVVNNEGSEELFQESMSVDKTKKNYPALHGLLCEPSPLFDEIKTDILYWLDERVMK
jgi:alpha-beta hydrolase superfamily lysophospholipase